MSQHLDFFRHSREGGGRGDGKSEISAETPNPAAMAGQGNRVDAP